ncbi:bifunctional UDP-sugar hydrolase/5'-nucleotidase [Vibrio splendidus]
MNFTKSLLVLSIGVAMVGCGSDNDDDIIAPDMTLRIAHVNDTHSNFDPVKSSFTMGTDGKKVYNEFGGYPRLLKAADDIKADAKADKEPLLFLHGGDAWQGTAYFKLNEGAANADLLSRMGLDAMVLGNHEFDLDTDKLASFINTVSFPVLANNMDASKDQSLSNVDNLYPYQLFAFEGSEKRAITSVSDASDDEKVVAVIGVVLGDMPTIATGTGDVTFSDQITATQATINDLKTKGVNKIIVLSHIGNAADKELAANTTGIDIIVGGHSHTLLGDFTDLDQGNNGIYAEMIPQKDKTQNTCVVQAGQYAEAIGDVDVSFDINGNLMSCVGNNTLLSNDEFYHDSHREHQMISTDKDDVTSFIDNNEKITTKEEDIDLRTRIDATYKPALEAAYGDVVAAAPTEISHERRPGDAGTDKHGSDVAPMIAQGMIYWANQPSVTAVTGKNVQIGLVGAGGVRTDIASGDFREGNATLELLPFSNYLSILTIKGEVIRDLIDSTIEPTLAEGAHAGKFPYVSGMRYTFTEDVKGVSGTVTALEVNTGTEENPVWTTMSDATNYTVIVNNYNASGSDGWNALGDAQLTSTDRQDIVISGDSFKTYKVNNLTYDGNTKKYSVNYDGGIKPCADGSGEKCNTDAESFISWAEHKKVLEPLGFETTTMEYK